MADVLAQSISPAGLAPVYTAVNATDKITNPGSAALFIHVKNAGGSPCTVAVDDPTSQAPPGSAAFNPDLSVVVPATTGDRMIGPIPASRFANPADSGKVVVTYSFLTSVTAAILQV